jgi:hypothetical protein
VCCVVLCLALRGCVNGCDRGLVCRADTSCQRLPLLSACRGTYRGRDRGNDGGCTYNQSYVRLTEWGLQCESMVHAPPPAHYVFIEKR